MLNREIIEEQIAKNPEDAELWFLLGNSITPGEHTAENNAEYNKKRESYQEAVRLNPLHKQATLELAKLHEKDGNDTLAKLYYEKTKQLAPDMPGMDEAIIRCTTNHNALYERSLDLHLNNVAREPGNGEAWKQLGGLYKELGKFEQSLECLEKARTLDPHCKSLNLFFAWTYSRMGRHEDAIRSFENEIEIAPDADEKARLMEHAGGEYNDVKDYPKARDYYLKALDTYRGENDNSCQRLYMVGLTYYMEQNFFEAVKYFQKSLDAATEENIVNTIYSAIGDSYYHLGELEEAKEWFEKAVALRKDDAHAFFGLGVIHQELGDDDLAETAFKMALNSNGLRNDARLNLGVVYQRRGDFKAAIELYEKCVELDVSFIPAYRNLALVYGVIGDEEKIGYYIGKFLEHGGNPQEFDKFAKN